MLWAGRQHQPGVPWGEFCRRLTQSAENHEVKQPSCPPLRVKISLPIPQGSIFGNIFPVSRNKKDLARHCVVLHQRAQPYIYVQPCNGRNATLQRLVSAGVSGGEGQLYIWLISPHSSLAGFCWDPSPGKSGRKPP